METDRIRGPGWKKVGSGIRDKHTGSATLQKCQGTTTLIIRITHTDFKKVCVKYLPLWRKGSPILTLTTFTRILHQKFDLDL
jgi:hypothetical protein